MAQTPSPAVLPAYVARSGEQELVPPCPLTSTQFYVFLLKGDQAKLQALLDRLFNVPTGGAVRYEAFWDHVALMFTHVDRLSSADASQGWAAYGDIALWVPFLDKTGGGGLVPVVKMYPAYMIVNNGSTMATGREVYGFPKEMGWFVEPQNPEYIGDLAADVLGYDANSTVQEMIRNRIWTLQRGAASTPATPVGDFKSIINELEKLLRGVVTLGDELLIALNFLRDGFSLPALGLKQFRDIADPSKAVFQSIVEAPLGMKKFRSASILGTDYSFILEDLITHPVAADTGLKIGPQPVTFGFWLYADFALGTGKTNWTSPATGPAT